MVDFNPQMQTPPNPKRSDVNMRPMDATRGWGDDTLYQGAEMMGFTGHAGNYNLAGMATGFIPGPVGYFSQMMFDTGARTATVSDELEDIASTSPFYAYLMRRGSEVDEKDPVVTLRKMLPNNSVLDRFVQAQEDAGMNAGAAGSMLGGGLIANALLPGSGLIMGGITQVGGGIAGSMAYDAMTSTGQRQTNMATLTKTVLKYQESGGVVDANMAQAVLALRTSEETQQLIEEEMLRITGNHYSLEEALGEYMDARKHAQESGNTRILMQTSLGKAMNSKHIDAMVRQELTTMEADDLAGTQSLTLAQAFMLHGMHFHHSPLHGEHVSQHDKMVKHDLGVNAAQLLLGDMNGEVAEIRIAEMKAMEQGMLAQSNPAATLRGMGVTQSGLTSTSSLPRLPYGSTPSLS